MSGFAEGTPTVEITLGGKSYTVGYSWGGKRRAREYFVKSGADPNGAHEEQYLSALLWACLDKDARSELSVEDVEDMINPGNEEEITQRFKKIIKQGEPNEEPEGKTKPAAVAKPTAGSSESKISGQLVSTT